jgi:starch phosphorylase
VEIVTHTQKSLGPKAVAPPMVAEYVRRLYVPAAASSTRMFDDDFAAARELATWRHTIESNWPAVAVLHVDSQLTGNVADAQLGSSLTLRAEVTLGDLQPEDVQVQAVYGTVDADDRLTDVQTAVLGSVPNGDGTHRYEGEIPLDRTGTFGYTVRVLPDNELLASPAELGLVASA